MRCNHITSKYSNKIYIHKEIHNAIAQKDAVQREIDHNR